MEQAKAFDVCYQNPVPAQQDTYVVHVFAISAWAGFAWWVITLFTYVKTFNPLKSGTGTNTVPLFWMWEFLIDPNYGWMAASYLTAFFVNIFVAFFELIAWFFYIGGRPGWLLWWTETVGWWFSTMGLVFPWLFAIFQYAFPEDMGGFNGDITIEGGYNAIFLLAGNLFQWVNASMTHLFLGNRFSCHVKSLEPVRKKTVYKKCPVKRTFGQTDREYQQACKDFFAKGGAEPAASAVDEEEAL